MGVVWGGGGGVAGQGKRTSTFGAFLLACYCPDTGEYQVPHAPTPTPRPRTHARCCCAARAHKTRLGRACARSV